MLRSVQSGRRRGRLLASTSILSISGSVAWTLLSGLLAADLCAAEPAQQETQETVPLPDVSITLPRPRPNIEVSPPSPQPTRRPAAPPRPPATSTPTPPPRTQPVTAGEPAATSPLNTGGVAESATYLGIPVRQVPATVEVVNQQTMTEQGYRTTTETAQGAVGVLSGDAAGAPAGFSMRGFDFSQVNILYNDINIGPQSFTSRVMDTFTLDRVEFLKGPSSLMSGEGAIGGAVNYVNKLPTTGPVKNEAFTTVDTLGSVRSGFGSGGSTSLPGLDYRFDMTTSKVNSFINDDSKNLQNLYARWNYRAAPDLKTFFAFNYIKDAGNSYWGTPVVPVAFAGPYATSGVVSGSAFSHSYNNNFLGPVTIDSRTLTTNYNVLDNFTGATQLWLRSGFEFAPLDGVTFKNQGYAYTATRRWLDSETYAFNTATQLIDRDRFFVSHNQKVVGNISDLLLVTNLFGMENRFATRVSAQHNEILFRQHPGNFPQDSVDVVDPARGYYGDLVLENRESRLDTLSVAFEDRLKITPEFALIGGARVDGIMLERGSWDAAGNFNPGYPFAKTWAPVSYRAAYTWEPIRNLVFYSMYATAYDPAIASIFSVNPNLPILLTSSRIYETGVKNLFWDNKAEWTLSVYDIVRRNVYQAQGGQVFAVAGEVAVQGVEFAAAVRPFDGWKFWGNVAFTHARYVNFDFDGGSFSGNTPPNVAPLIVNIGASYRFNTPWWPVEIGGSMRHVGPRYLFDDNQITMDAYTLFDAYMFIDLEKGRLFPTMDSTRLTFRARNLTNKVYAAWSDPGYPDQVYLGAPRTFEVGASFKF